jgi:hexosaminidase
MTDLAACELLVHLDMKGAPPPSKFLVELMPHFRDWGATGLLIEWEDMLPFEGPLERIRHPEAYSADEVGRAPLDASASRDVNVVAQVRMVLAAAKACGLTVTPLVQTFGHLEFVLKHLPFGAMREERDNYMDLCPVSDGAQALATELVQQVLALHPGCRRIHVGCDEVFGLGTNPASATKAAVAGEERLFLDHVMVVLRECARLKVTPLLWHDMMARYSIDALKRVAESGAQVVVWSYGLEVEDALPADMWPRFERAGLKIWGASAFKGASQPDALWVPTARHVANHESWVRRARRTALQGVILTGWARFNHTAALCETLSAGIPSLALNLSVVRAGGYSDSLRKHVWRALGLPSGLGLAPSAQELSSFHTAGKDPTFPGGGIFRLLAALESARLQFSKTLENRRLFCPPYTHRLNPPLWRRMAWHARAARTTIEGLRSALLASASGVFTPSGIAELTSAKATALAQQAADVLRDMRGLMEQHSGLMMAHDISAGRPGSEAEGLIDDDDDGTEGVGLEQPRVVDASPRAVLASLVGTASDLGIRGGRAVPHPNSASYQSFEARHLMLDPRWFLLGLGAIGTVQAHTRDDASVATTSVGQDVTGWLAPSPPADDQDMGGAVTLQPMDSDEPGMSATPMVFSSSAVAPPAGGSSSSSSSSATDPRTDGTPHPFSSSSSSPKVRTERSFSAAMFNTPSSLPPASHAVPASMAAMAAAVGVASSASPIVTPSMALLVAGSAGSPSFSPAKPGVTAQPAVVSSGSLSAMADSLVDLGAPPLGGFSSHSRDAVAPLPPPSIPGVVRVEGSEYLPAVSLPAQALPTVGFPVTGDDMSAPAAFGPVALGGGIVSAQAPGALLEGGMILPPSSTADTR